MLRAVREHAVVFGMCALALLCVGLLLFDGVVFYANAARSRTPIAGNQKKSALSEQEVIDTLKLVDQRQKEFDAVLGAFSASGNLASSTKAK